MKKLRIIEIPSEIGAGTRGASLGIDAIKVAGWNYRSHFFKQQDGLRVEAENDSLYEPARSPFAKRIRGIVKLYERTSAAVKETIDRGFFPLVLSGDHSSAGGVITGLKMAWPKARLGVIWIDAHADLHSPYTTPSGNVHGMPLAAMLGEDNQQAGSNPVDKETQAYWEQLKGMGNLRPKLAFEDIVFITIRDFEGPEARLMEQHRMKKITTHELRRKGIGKVVKEAFQHLGNCQRIFISFDVDSLDPTVSKGTGTPVAGGITKKQAANLIVELIQNEKACCFEITEVNPTLDMANSMAEAAFEILQKVANQLEKN